MTRRRETTGQFPTAELRTEFLAAYERALSRLPDPISQDDLAVPGGTVRIYRFGDAAGVPLVLLPGTGATPRWGSLIGRLAVERTVWSIDPLGRAGHSEQTGPLRLDDDEAAWTEATLDGIGLSAAHLVGTSVGAWLAVNHQVRRPGWALSLSLLDPEGVFGPRRRRRWRRRARSAPELATTADRFIERLPPREPLADLDLASLPVPVLLVLSGTAGRTSRRAARRAEHLVPDLALERWPGAPPVGDRHDPERVARRLLTFVAGAERR